MATSRNARQTESLMRYQPLPFVRHSPPQEEHLCEVCSKALKLAEDMFASVVTETLNDYTIGHVLSMDLKHHEAPETDLWKTRFPTKDTWQHSLRCYNHTRTEYVTDTVITLCYRAQPHTEKCKYAYINVDLFRGVKADIPHAYITRNIVKRLLLDSRRYCGPGTTTLERQANKDFTSYQIHTVVGSTIVFPVTIGYTRERGWTHNNMEEAEIPIEHRQHRRHSDAAEPEPIISTRQPSFATATPNRSTIVIEEIEDEFTINTPRRRLSNRKQTI